MQRRKHRRHRIVYPYVDLTQFGVRARRGSLDRGRVRYVQWNRYRVAAEFFHLAGHVVKRCFIATNEGDSCSPSREFVSARAAHASARPGYNGRHAICVCFHFRLACTAAFSIFLKVT